MGLRDRVKSALGVGGPTFLKPGDPAPALDAADGAGERWSWAKLAGNPAIVYFYPADDTPGCTREACDFRDGWEALRNAGVALFGVSPDDAASHQAFAGKFQLPFPLLVDDGGELTRRWGVRGLRGTRRVTFLVDGQGRIARVWDPVAVEGHAAEVMAAVQRL